MGGLGWSQAREQADQHRPLKFIKGAGWGEQVWREELRQIAGGEILARRLAGLLYRFDANSRRRVVRYQIVVCAPAEERFEARQALVVQGLCIKAGVGLFPSVVRFDGL